MAEIKFVELCCQRCGCALEERGDNFVCTACGKMWQKETLRDFTDMLEACEEALRNQRVSDIANLRQLLWKETHKEYISNKEVERLCKKIQEYLPQDFYANCYLATCSKNKTELGGFLYKVNVGKHYDDIPLILDYLLVSLKPEWAMGVSNFIEKIKDIDTALYHKYRTLFEKEYQKTDEGVFEADLKRDVFIAYSSADMPKVMELVAALEEENIYCFVAARNMRHGSGSVENYRNLLHTAIENCTVFVFVSSNNSRSFNCDAYREEISYINQHCKNMPRVEYLIQNYSGRAVERNFKIFFSGLEYCVSPRDVVERVADILMNGVQPSKTQTVEETPESESVNNNTNNNAYDDDLAKQLKRAHILIETEDFNEATSVISKIESGEEARVGTCEIPEIYHYKLLIEYAARNDGELINKLVEKQVDITKNKNYRFAVDYAEERKNDPELKALSSIKDKIKDGIAEAVKAERKARVARDCQIENGVLIKYKGSESEVFIPDGVTAIGKQAFYYCESLKIVIVPDGVTSIGESAFYGCKSLTSIIIPDSVTSIGKEAFSRCESLTSVSIPNSVTSIGESAFGWCKSLTDITIPNSVNSIGKQAFYYCESLKIVIVPDGVTSIGESAFYGCKSLTDITIPNSVTSIGESAFGWCKSLTSIIIPDSLASISECLFNGCYSLKSITIPNGVTSIGAYVFGGCESLTSITIPNSVTSISVDMLYYKGIGHGYCKSLTSINVSSDNKTYKSIDGNLYSFDGKTLLLYAIGKAEKSFTIPDGVTSVGRLAFHGCSSLTSIIIPNSVTSIDNWAFQGCSSLTSITIPKGMTSVGYGAFNICTSLASINVSSGNKTYKSVDGNLYDFKGKTLLHYAIGKTAKSFTIPRGVTAIGGRAFACSKFLTDITIPKGVISIGAHAFGWCESLKSITIANSVTSIGKSAFICCASLTDITIANSVVFIGEWAFFNCESLKSITIPNSVTSIGKNAFFSCESLKSITIPNSVTSIGESAFRGCKSLTDITIPNSVTSIGESAFSDCKSLTDITIPNSVTSIGEGAFFNCESLKSITIPNSVTSIGKNAFFSCESLKSITIPNSVTSIGERAFSGCKSLKTVYCEAVSKPEGWNNYWLGCDAEVVWGI